MAKNKAKKRKNYDVFISYRYDKKDAYVADELRRQLEKYKVPKSIRNQLKNKRKYKLGSIFQDKLKLSVSADLWRNIQDALDRTKYLVLICSPRVKGENWCNKEVEYFVSVRGRDYVLPILAEGEPQDSFPDVICEEYYEVADDTGNVFVEKAEVLPLAADVRGDSKREIKKKIKEAVPKIIAPILGIEYENLVRRRKEELWKKCAAVFAAVSIVLFVFGSVSYIQMQRLEESMRENMYQQQIITANVAEKYLEEGMRHEAVEAIMEVLPENVENPDGPLYMTMFNHLAESIRIYDPGIEYVSTGYSYTDTATGASFVSDVTFPVNDRCFAVVSETSRKIHIWDCISRRRIAKFDLAIDFEQYYGNYGTMRYEDIIRITEDMLYYSDDNGVYAVSTQDFQTVWKYDKNDTRSGIFTYGGVVYVYNTGSIAILDGKNGQLLAEKTDWSDIPGELCLIEPAASMDHRNLYVISCCQDLEYYLNQIDTITMEVVNSIFIDSGFELANPELYMDIEDDRLYLNYQAYKENDDETSNCVCAYDTASMDLLWLNCPPYYCEKILDINTSEDELLLTNGFEIVCMSRQTGDVIWECSFDSGIVNIYTEYQMEYGWDVIEVLLDNGQIMCSDWNSLVDGQDGFYIFSSAEEKNGNVYSSFFKLGQNYVAVPSTGSRYYILDRKQVNTGEETLMPEFDDDRYSEHTRDQIPMLMQDTVCNGECKAVVEKEEQMISFYEKDEFVCEVPLGKAEVSAINYSYDNRFFFVMYEDRLVDVFPVYKKQITREEVITLSQVYIFFIEPTSDADYIILDTDRGTKIYYYDEKQNTFEPYASVNAFCYYDTEKQMICQLSENVPRFVPVYSPKQIAEYAKKYMEESLATTDI